MGHVSQQAPHPQRLALIRHARRRIRPPASLGEDRRRELAEYQPQPKMFGRLPGLVHRPVVNVSELARSHTTTDVPLQ